MATHIPGIFDENTSKLIRESNVLVVGAGGIGCELLKGLVLTGFENITVVDLDTIELSNLNRQFLFHREHIKKSKAVVARESVLKFNPKANIVAHHDSINSSKFDYSFFKQFTLVTNALDNIAARSHVNRMCMNAQVPLIESGSAGYLGQVAVYKQGQTECFECLPRKGQKEYPSCTIRNTPSEPVHCIVWAKHLFSQLFGEHDADNDVSPDVESATNESGNVERVSTKESAKNCGYDPSTIFNKLYKEDIGYLNTMHDLWEKRSRPKTLDWNIDPDQVPETNDELQGEKRDHTVWSLNQCKSVFASCLEVLKKRSEESESNLTWDKDDDIAVDFVTACANLRSHCFYIAQQTRFKVKEIAGNIIPAIASTNDTISGLIVLQAIKVLKDVSKCRNTWLNENAAAGKRISSSELEKANPKCHICSKNTPEIIVHINFNTLIVRTVGDKILKERLHMVEPEVTVEGSARIIISADPEELDASLTEKTIAAIGNVNSLHCCDDLQQCSFTIFLIHDPKLKDQEFRFENDVAEVPTETADNKNSETKVDEDEEMMILEQGDSSLAIKNKLIEDSTSVSPPAKKAKTAE